MRTLVILMLMFAPARAQQTPPQAPPATMPNSEITAREVLSVLNERTSANDARFNAQEKAVAAALSAAKEAVAKAEAASEKRFEGLNEFRGTLKDQQNTYITRTEVTAVIRALDEKVQSLDSRLTVVVARGEGINWFVGLVGGLLGGLAGLIGAVSVAWRRSAAP